MSSIKSENDLPDYAPLLISFHEEFADELRAMIATLPVAAGDKVLEVAAGDGKFAVWLSERVGRQGAVTATDISKSWLHVAKENVREEGRQGCVGLDQADAKQLPYSDGEFDFVWCAQSLYSLPRTEQCLAEMRRVLKPGGTIALLENDSLHHVLLPWPPALELQIYQAELRSFRKSSGPAARFYAGRWLSRLLRKNDFRQPQERSFAHSRQQPLSDAARQYFQSYLQAQRERVAPFLTERALQRFDRWSDPDGSRSFWRQRDFVAVCLDRVVWAER